MAKETKIIITDDIDGSTGAQTEIFGYGGLVRQIDLSSKNKARFEEAIREFVDHSEVVRVDGRPAVLPTTRGFSAGIAQANTKTTAEYRRKVRNWWKVQPASRGLPSFSARGQIPGKVIVQFEEDQRRRM